MIRSSLRALVLPGLAGALLAGCATGYGYQAGPGDYYYGQPEVHYNDYGYGGWYGGWYGGYPYYWGGGYPYGPYWGPPYWGPPHWHRPVVHPPHHDPPPPGHGPGPGNVTDDRGPDRIPPPRPVTPGRPMHPVPAPRSVTVPRPVTGMQEREPHRKTTP